MIASSPIDAAVVSSTIDTAIESPRPNAAPLASPARAFVVDVESGSAMTDTLPVPLASATVAPLPIVAVLEASTRLNASDPAIEFLPPPAPDVASGPYVFALSVPTVSVFDSRVSDPALMEAPDPTDASVVTIATFTPTAAPMVLPVAGPVVVAEPSAFAVESVLPFADSLVAAVPELS